jgi:hypothetical protein
MSQNMNNSKAVVPNAHSVSQPREPIDAAPIWRLRIIAYAMILVSVLAVGTQVYRDYDENIAYQTRILHQLGRSAADRIGSKITLIDAHLREILADLPQTALTSLDGLRAMGTTREMYELLRRRRYDLNNLDAFACWTRTADC